MHGRTDDTIISATAHASPVITQPSRAQESRSAPTFVGRVAMNSWAEHVPLHGATCVCYSCIAAGHVSLSEASSHNRQRASLHALRPCREPYCVTTDITALCMLSLMLHPAPLPLLAKLQDQTTPSTCKRCLHRSILVQKCATCIHAAEMASTQIF